MGGTRSRIRKSAPCATQPSLRQIAPWLCWLALVFTALLPTPALAQSGVLQIDGDGKQWSLLETMVVSHDIPDEASFDDVQSGAFDSTFLSHGGEVPNLSGDEGSVWVKARIRNVGQHDLDAQVVLKFPQPREISFYIEREAKRFATIERGSAGAVEASYAGRFPHADISIPAGQERSVYLRLASKGPILIPLQLFANDHFGAMMSQDYLIFGILIGCLIAIAIHSGLTFAATREPAFGWFVIFALASAGFILTGTGMAKAVIYPNLAFNSTAVLMFAQGMGNMASALFLASYLKTGEVAPRLHKLIMALAAIAFIGSFSSFIPNQVSMPLVALSVLVGPTVLFATNAFLAAKKVQGARTLLFGWCFVQAGTAWIFLRALDIVPYTEINHYALPVAATYTALHFSWALTNRARRAEHRATHDALTKLPNRFRLETVAQGNIHFSRRFSAVLQVDLDGFKRINDTLGHAAGDHVLKTVAERISSAVQNDGQVFRLGGDEFVVLVTKRRNPPNLVAIANRIIVASSQIIMFRDEETRVGASVGIALPNADDRNLSETMERADMALYEAKRAGKGRLNFSDLETEREVLSQALARKAA